MFISKSNLLEYRIKELHDAIKVLRKNSYLDELCFRIYLSGEDINLYRDSLEEEAKNFGYNIYFKPGNVGTTLGMLKDATQEYWE